VEVLAMKKTAWMLSGIAACLLVACCVCQADEPAKSDKEPTPLPGTKPLTLKGDIAAQLVAGVDKFLLREIDKSVERRAKHWKRDFSSAEAYNKSIEPNRKRLAHILGIRDKRVPFDAPELVGTTKEPALVGKGENYEIFAVRWPAFGDVHGEGLLLVPKGKKIVDVVAIPDADQTPEQIVGLEKGVPKESQFARRLAESGCRVIVPVLIDRKLEKRNGRANLTSREFLYRSAFELGRHLIGYEVQKVLAAVDWFAKEGEKERAEWHEAEEVFFYPHIGVFGYGEGGMIALYAAALDKRIDSACVSGYFAMRHQIWQEPIDRNVFGKLEEFGDGELASMTSRHLLINIVNGPMLTLPSEGGAPAQLRQKQEHATGEAERVRKLFKGTKVRATHITTDEALPGDDRVLKKFLLSEDLEAPGKPPRHLRKHFDPRPRQLRQQHEIDRHNQRLLEESQYVRADFMKELYDAGKDQEKFAQVQKKYREFFAKEVIGRFDYKLLPPNPRSRKWDETDKWTAYEVVLDVFPDVIAYGILLIPKDLKKDEKRPVVVCQHGLEGKPEHVIKGNHDAYHDFAAKLAERGFITFAPQNLYIGGDKFRTLQRKANPLGKTLFSIIVPQHQQITDWLKTLPFVDGSRIGFYGLSYGGKSAMRIPPLVTNYCLSICSADFNEWVWKNASTSPRNPYSYVWTGEYEIFEFDLGSTFNYAEMAALIAPRPFMVERGHFDGVAPDEKVGHEFAKVRNFYETKLGLKDQCEIEWFVGPHTINGKGTFEFLHKHLKWPKR
jgi:dienelactone hydrolase